MSRDIAFFAGFEQSHITLLFLLRIDKFSWLVDFLLPGVTSVTSFFVKIFM